MIAIVAQYTINFNPGENGRFTDLASRFAAIDRTVLLTSDFSHREKKKKQPDFSGRSFMRSPIFL